MNHQTQDILKEAKRAIQDQGVFSEDQITALEKFTDLIADAIAKESLCIGSGINHRMSGQ